MGAATDLHGNELGTVYLLKAEGGSVRHEYVSEDSYDALKRQRDELLTALDWCVDQMNGDVEKWVLETLEKAQTT